MLKEEYALAFAAEPALGNAGRVIVAIAAMMATASAINATAFGASRMMAKMAKDEMLPRAFSFRRRSNDVPWVAIVIMTGLGFAFSALNTLETIAAFSSLTLLLVSIGVSAVNLRLHRDTRSNPLVIATGILVALVTIGLLTAHMWTESRRTLVAVLVMYGGVVAAEFLFSQRSRLWRAIRRRQ